MLNVVIAEVKVNGFKKNLKIIFNFFLFMNWTNTDCWHASCQHAEKVSFNSLPESSSPLYFQQPNIRVTCSCFTFIFHPSHLSQLSILCFSNVNMWNVEEFVNPNCVIHVTGENLEVGAGSLIRVKENVNTSRLSGPEYRFSILDLGTHGLGFFRCFHAPTNLVQLIISPHQHDIWTHVNVSQLCWSRTRG